VLSNQLPWTQSTEDTQFLYPAVDKAIAISNKMIPLLTIFLQILEVTNAFSRSGVIRTAPTLQQEKITSSQPYAWRRARAGRRGGISLLNEGIGVDSTLRNDTLDILNTELPLSVDSETMAMDQGKEIFFEAIAVTKPEETMFIDENVSEGIAVESTRRNGTLDSLNTELPPSIDSEAITMDQGKEVFFEAIAVTNPEEIMFIDDNVSAMLAASQDAIAAAEASMPKELIQKLELGGANETPATLAVEPELPEILSAAAVVGESVTYPKISAPPVSKILKFAIPAIGVWLCGPLLSLIDTSAVGILSGTTQQAALNPAVAVTDYTALLIVSPVFVVFCWNIHGPARHI
jgi:hypothetical protein